MSKEQRKRPFKLSNSHLKSRQSTQEILLDDVDDPAVESRTKQPKIYYNSKNLASSSQPILGNQLKKKLNSILASWKPPIKQTETTKQSISSDYASQNSLPESNIIKKDTTMNEIDRTKYFEKYLDDSLCSKSAMNDPKPSTNMSEDKIDLLESATGTSQDIQENILQLSESSPISLKETDLLSSIKIVSADFSSSQNLLLDKTSLIKSSPTIFMDKPTKTNDLHCKHIESPNTSPIKNNSVLSELEDSQDKPVTSTLMLSVRETSQEVLKENGASLQSDHELNCTKMDKNASYLETEKNTLMNKEYETLARESSSKDYINNVNQTPEQCLNNQCESFNNTKLTLEKSEGGDQVVLKENINNISIPEFENLPVPETKINSKNFTDSQQLVTFEKIESISEETLLHEKKKEGLILNSENWTASETIFPSFSKIISLKQKDKQQEIQESTPKSVEEIGNINLEKPLSPLEVCKKPKSEGTVPNFEVLNEPSVNIANKTNENQCSLNAQLCEPEVGLDDEFCITDSQLDSIEKSVVSEQRKPNKSEFANFTTSYFSNRNFNSRNTFAPEIPSMRWMIQMQEDRKRLQTIVREISQLNAMLTRAIKEIWPTKK